MVPLEQMRRCVTHLACPRLGTSSTSIADRSGTARADPGQGLHGRATCASEKCTWGGTVRQAVSGGLVVQGHGKCTQQTHGHTTERLFFTCAIWAAYSAGIATSGMSPAATTSGRAAHSSISSNTSGFLSAAGAAAARLRYTILRYELRRSLTRLTSFLRASVVPNLLLNDSCREGGSRLMIYSGGAPGESHVRKRTVQITCASTYLSRGRARRFQHDGTHST